MKSCRYLIKYKEYKSLNSTGTIYRCILANALLISKDLDQKWACKGCIIPRVMKSKPCKHLNPHKNILIRGSSHTWFSCKLFNIVMDIPAEFCQSNCKLYEPVFPIKDDFK